MEKRLILVVVLCAGIYFAWKFIFPDKHPTSLSTNPEISAVNPPESNKVVNGVPGYAPEEIIVENPGFYRTTLTTWGGGISSFQLLSPKYSFTDAHVLRKDAQSQQIWVETRKGNQPTEMVATYEPSLRMGFSPKDKLASYKDQIPNIQDKAWKFESASSGCQYDAASKVYKVAVQDCEIKYSFEENGWTWRKLLRFPGSARGLVNYSVPVSLEIVNNTSQAQQAHVVAQLTGFQDAEQKEGFFSKKILPTQVVWDLDGKMRIYKLSEVQDKDISDDKLRGQVRWLGLDKQYFLQGLGIIKDGDKQIQTSATAKGALTINVEGQAYNFQPGKPANFQFIYFAGPKIDAILEDIKINDTSVGFDNSIDYTLAFIAKPLLWGLRQIYRVVPNWALAIVLLTLLVKILTLYPSYRSTKSMKAMADLKPQMDALKAKYGNDQQRLNQETLELYRKKGINPLGGCLPMLLQMPIYFALFSMLRNAVELYNVPLWWIKDLTSSDPYFIFPAVTGLTMFLQTKLSPTSADPQQKMLAWMMPAMFVVFSIFSPAGLSVYFITNTVLSIIQQLVLNPNAKSEKKKKV